MIMTIISMSIRMQMMITWSKTAAQVPFQKFYSVNHSQMDEAIFYFWLGVDVKSKIQEYVR